MPDETAVAEQVAPVVADEAPEIAIDYGPDVPQPEDPEVVADSQPEAELASEPEAEEPKAEQETRLVRTADEWLDALLRNPKIVKQIPAAMVGDVLEKRDQRIFQQAQAQANAERELQTKFSSYEEAYKDGDLDAINELAEADPHTASQWFFARAQQLYQRSPQAQQQQTGQQAQTRMVTRVQTTYARLEDHPEAKAEVDKWLATLPNPGHIDPTDDSLDDFRDRVTAAIVRHERAAAKETEEEPAEPRRRPLRPDVRGSAVGGGLSDIHSYETKLAKVGLSGGEWVQYERLRAQAGLS